MQRDNPFPSDRLYWVGVDPVEADDDADMAAVDGVFETIAACEGLDVRTMTRLTLAQQDARGDIGARYVAVFRVGADEDLDAFEERQRGREWSSGELAPRWRLLYERFLEVGEPEPLGSPVVLVAMTPAADATPTQVDEFNAFYDDIHLHEVLRDWDWRRVSRYERRFELQHPAPGSPQYLAIYEAGPGTRAVPRSAEGLPNYSSGPYAWEARNTAWRLRYDVQS